MQKYSGLHYCVYCDEKWTSPTNRKAHQTHVENITVLFLPIQIFAKKYALSTPTPKFTPKHCQLLVGSPPNVSGVELSDFGHVNGCWKREFVFYQDQCQLSFCARDKRRPKAFFLVRP